MTKPNPFPKRWPIFDKDEINITTDILHSGKVNYWTGNQGKLFEQEFANYHGVKYSIALANGTLALELALSSFNIGNGDEVIVPSRTYIATASSVFVVGAKPIVADVDRQSGNISVETIKSVKTKKTKAIIVVHIAGWPCDMQSIMSYAKKNNLIVIEDCAQAHGAEINTKKVGSFGDASAFSFCQDKIMTTCGEGGMVLFKNKAQWLKAWSFKDHGKSYKAVHKKDKSLGFKWLVESFGSNYRMTEIQSAVGRLQLKKLDKWLSIRQKNADFLDAFFKKFDSFIRVPEVPKHLKHARYKYYIYLNSQMMKKNFSRDRIIKEFNKNHVPCFSGSCSEIYLEKAFKKSGLSPKKRHVNAKELGETSLTFLIDPAVSKSDLRHLCDVGESIFKKAFIQTK